MSASRSKSPSPAVAEEPTPTPASAVGTKSSVAPEPSQHGAERHAALLRYFADPSPEICEMDAAWQEALTLYGDEDSDAWVAALEDGTHPLCKVRALEQSA